MAALISLTGVDGSGKSTQIDLLRDALVARGDSVHRAWCRWKPLLPRPLLMLSKGTVFRKTAVKDYNVGQEDGEKFQAWQSRKQSLFRRGWLRRAYFGFAVCDYWLQITWKVRLPRLLGKTVLADRYLCDLVIDQAINFDWSEEELVASLRAWWTHLFPRPDALVFLDVTEQVALARRADIPSLDYLRTRRRLYLAVSQAMGYSIVSADQAIDQVHAAILDTVLSKGKAVG